MSVYSFLVLVAIAYAALYYVPLLAFRALHRRIWRRLADERGWKFELGEVYWLVLTPLTTDRLTGTYRGRPFTMKYSAGLRSKFIDSNVDFFSMEIQLISSRSAKGYFRLDQNKLFRKNRGKLNDRAFDKTTRIIKETSKGFTGGFLIDPTLRKRVSRFFSSPWQDYRKISLTPTGRLKLQDSGYLLSGKRLFAALDLLSDLAGVSENYED